MDISARELKKYFEASCEYLAVFTSASEPDFRFEGFDAEAAGTHVSLIISFLQPRTKGSGLLDLAPLLKFERIYQKVMLDKEYSVLKIEPYSR